MQAWRVYALGDMRLDMVPYPTLKSGGVILKTRVVQPSITEVVRSRGGPTSGSETVKKFIAENAPVQLFGHEFCAEVVEVGHRVHQQPLSRFDGGRIVDQQVSELGNSRVHGVLLSTFLAWRGGG